MLADIDKMLDELEIQRAEFQAGYIDAKGETRRCYKLPAREVLILVSGYKIELRAAVIDRLKELELQVQREKIIEAYDIPRDYVSALRLAADQTEKLVAALKQIEDDKPKVAFHDAITETPDVLDIAGVAKLLAIDGYGRNNLLDALRRHGILMADNKPYQKYVDAKCFRVVEVLYNTRGGPTKAYLKTVVFQKGIELYRRIVELDRSGGAA